MKKPHTFLIIVAAILTGAFATYYSYLFMSGGLASSAVREGDMVYVNYTDRLADGTKFDSSYDKGEPFGFLVGAGMVIKGRDEAVVGMRVGEKKTLAIPADKAYGAQGVSNGQGGYSVPPDAPIVSEMEVVRIERP